MPQYSQTLAQTPRGHHSVRLTPCRPACRSDGYRDGRVALYRLPPSGTPKGTCIFIHGCKHDPYSWFYKSDACPLCTGAAPSWAWPTHAEGAFGRPAALSLRRPCSGAPNALRRLTAPCPLTFPCAGLPEEVAHSKQCLAHGFAVLALMSKNRIQNGPVARCFASSGAGSEWRR